MARLMVEARFCNGVAAELPVKTYQEGYQRFQQLADILMLGEDLPVKAEGGGKHVTQITAYHEPTDPNAKLDTLLSCYRACDCILTAIEAEEKRGPLSVPNQQLIVPKGSYQK